MKYRSRAARITPHICIYNKAIVKKKKLKEAAETPDEKCQIREANDLFTHIEYVVLSVEFMSSSEWGYPFHNVLMHIFCLA